MRGDHHGTFSLPRPLERRLVPDQLYPAEDSLGPETGKGEEFHERAADLNERLARQVARGLALDLRSERGGDVLDRDAPAAAHHPERDASQRGADRARPSKRKDASHEADRMECRNLDLLAKGTEPRVAHLREKAGARETSSSDRTARPPHEPARRAPREVAELERQEGHRQLGRGERRNLG